MSTRRERGVLAFWGELLALLTVFVAILGMFLSSPRFAGPDENAHQATAWFVMTHGLSPTAETVSTVPAIIPPQVCFAFSPEADTGCLGPRTSEGMSEVRTLNYPPVYYWAVGIGQRVALVVSEVWIDIGGRLASVVANIGMLVIVALLLRRATPQWGTYLLTVTTPMAAFLWAVVNPSGWEISSGLLFVVLFAQTWWGVGQGPSPGGVHKGRLVALAVSAIIFGLARHSAVLWLVLLIVAVLVLGKPRIDRMDQIKTVGATLTGLFAAGLWQITHPAQHPMWNPYPVEDPGPADYISWLGEIDNALTDRIRQMLGVLGWLDTPMPQWLMFLVLASWAMTIGIMFGRTRIPAPALILGFLGSIVVPAALEIIRWNDWPYWYQGRITLPFTLAFLLILLMRFGYVARRPVFLLSLISTFALAFMIFENLSRNAFGIKGYLPQRWSDPVMDAPLFWGSAACIGLVILLGLVRVWLQVLEGAAIRSETADSEGAQPARIRHS